MIIDYQLKLASDNLLTIAKQGFSVMKRKTKQRDSIFRTLEEADRPLSPKEILEYSKLQSAGIGIATIYRTIKEFLSTSAIIEVNTPGSSARYEVKVKKHHHHFWCRLCDRVFKVDGCPGKLNFFPPKGFRAEVHEVMFRGLCKACTR